MRHWQVDRTIAAHGSASPLEYLVPHCTAYSVQVYRPGGLIIGETPPCVVCPSTYETLRDYVSRVAKRGKRSGMPDDDGSALYSVLRTRSSTENSASIEKCRYVQAPKVSVPYLTSLCLRHTLTMDLWSVSCTSYSVLHLIYGLSSGRYEYK